ncbi:MAG: sensor histidine kinase [Parvibaculales bacterium]
MGKSFLTGIGSVMGIKATPFQRATFRLIAIFVGVFLLLNLIITPVAMNRSGKHVSQDIFNNGVLAAELVRNRPLSVLEKEILAVYQHVEGVKFYDPEAGYMRIEWFGAESNLPASPIRIDLGFDAPRESFVNLYRLFRAPRGQLGLITSADDKIGSRITVIFRHEALMEYILTQTERSIRFAAFMSFFIVLFLPRLFRRELSLSMTALLMRQKNSPVGFGRRASRVDDLEKTIAQHIDEQSRLASLGAGAARLAHDIRNVLASMQLFADRFVASDDDKDRRMGERMNISIERAVSLCDWTTQYSTATKRDIDYNTHAVRPLVNEVLTLVRLHDVANKVQLVNRVDAREQIDCERNLAFRIIYNVVLNAIQAIKSSGQRGRVVVTSRKEKQGMVLIIEDNGPGMDSETVGKLFVPYQGSLKPGGTGLGMAIADELTKWHGGQLELVATSSKGSIFELYLPYEAPSGDEDEAQSVA